MPARRGYIPRASTARILCCTKRGTELFSRSHSSASGQPNTWSGGEARQRRLGPGPLAPRSSGPSGTFDVALLPQRLQRGPPQQEPEELLPDLADVTLQASGPRGGRCCPMPMGTRGLGQSLPPWLGGPAALARWSPLPLRMSAIHLHPPHPDPSTPAPGRGSSSCQLPRRSLDLKSTPLFSLSSSGGRSAD